MDSIRITGFSGAGHREENQDTILIGNNVYATTLNNRNCFVETQLDASNRPILLGIFDGAGGAISGGTASRIAACAGLRHFLQAPIVPDNKSEYLENLALSCLAEADKAVYQSLNHRRIQSASTATIALLYDDRLIIANIGDSPAYVLDEKGNVHKSYTQHGYQNQLYRFCGRGSNEPAAIFSWSLSNTVKFLLTSDGITEQFVEPLLQGKLEVYEAARQSSKKSNDNVSCILAEVVSEL